MGKTRAPSLRKSDGRQISRSLALVADFAERACTASSLAHLGALLGDTAQGLGFRYHALVQHADLASPPPRFLFLQNYPPDWVASFARRGLHREDPAQRLAARRAGGFAWTDLPCLMPMSPSQMRLLEGAQRAGLGEGYTVPLHAPGERAASCSFVMAPGNSLEPAMVLAAELVAHLAFGKAHELSGPARNFPHLSRREEQCVVLMAQGKTDWEIGVILGLSEETITQYLKTARARFGVSRRTQLAVAAVCHGLIGLDEVISWQ